MELEEVPEDSRSVALAVPVKWVTAPERGQQQDILDESTGCKTALEELLDLPKSLHAPYGLGDLLLQLPGFPSRLEIGLRWLHR